jgi:hypothetical protein
MATKRRRLVQIRVTDDEYDKIFRAAELEAMPMATYVRWRLLRTEPRQDLVPFTLPTVAFAR